MKVTTYEAIVEDGHVPTAERSLAVSRRVLGGDGPRPYAGRAVAAGAPAS